MEEKEPDEIFSEEETRELETINLPINVSNLDRYEKVDRIIIKNFIKILRISFSKEQIF